MGNGPKNERRNPQWAPAQQSKPVEAVAPAPVVRAPLRPLRVVANYAFYDEDGAFKSWSERAIVTDPNEIELLTARKAPVEPVEE